ncbi:sensor domain-containing diguanylate cyclase [Cytobacillus depressus]|uniref:Sensor domain-containing diguanylate cyclase n=1 Tax=Cytobacillus depressus TaxID=1602942 RepID=A0A6L3VEA8_9BACI|nr:sensor domain-containing diguanylate cyclase [Cytobacillus depressus]KAB2338853.1 sensor domain-containing diguanylate cyclase [Cytobacillus depressus]
MVRNEHEMIIKLKSDLLDIIDIENGFFVSDDLLKNMLNAIKSLINAEEATLFSLNNCKNQLLIEASTSEKLEQTNCPQISIDALEVEAIQSNSLLFKLPGFEAYDLTMILMNNDSLLGILAIKGREEEADPFSHSILEAICQQIAKFLNNIRILAKTDSEEKRYKQLFRVTEKFHSSMNMDDVLGEIIHTLQEVYPTFTYYLLLSHDNNRLEDLPIKDLEYDSENIAALQAYVTGTVQLEDSVQKKRSVLYAPLKGKQGVYGVLQVIAPNTLVFPNNEVEFITLLANTAGSALENAQLYQQSKRLITDLKLINETSHRLNSNLRLAETMAYMTEQISHSFEAEEVGFILYVKDNQQIDVLKGSTEFFHKNAAEAYIQFTKEKIEKEQESLFIGDFQLIADTNVKQYKSIMAIPMTQSGVLKGFVLVMSEAPYHFSFETFKLLQSLIHHSTLAITNSMLREELEKMVVTDHLTKLYSRNYLDEKIHLSMNEDHEGTFILVDIDNFKSINDTFGHQVGDDVIIQVAGLINDNIRGTDIGARWGGEELAIYLPGVSLMAGVNIAERLLEKVREYSNPRVTISCGVSHWNRGKKDTYAALFKRADKALYVAKQTGKNKVIVQESDIVIDKT